MTVSEIVVTNLIETIRSADVSTGTGSEEANVTATEKVVAIAREIGAAMKGAIETGREIEMVGTERGTEREGTSATATTRSAIVTGIERERTRTGVASGIVRPMIRTGKAAPARR
jgi:hypothetical protein